MLMMQKVVDCMAKSSKPYNDNKTRKSKKELEQTTRIRIDKDRLNDYDSLDTSFLEGRLDKKSKALQFQDKLDL